MTDISKLLLIVISASLINNYLLIRFLGTCPFIGVSGQIDSAIGMGSAVIFVMTLTALITWPIQYLILVPLKIDFLQTIVFILVIAALVQFIEMFLNKVSPTLKRALGIYLPLITTNCAVLGVAIINIRSNYNFIEAAFSGFGAGLGFTIALIAMAGMRERLDLSPMPDFLRGAPITLIIASIMSMAFLGFVGLIT